MTLEAENLTKSFGGLRAADGISFSAHTDALTCITGPNGAGKTTVFNLLTGFYAPDAGKILLCGNDITRLKPAARARMGVARTFQNIRLLDEESALDNLITALHAELNGSLADTLLPTRTRARGLDAAREFAMEKLRFLALDKYALMPAGKLPYGARKSLEIARCLCLRPKLMLLDEPASGLNTQEAWELGNTLKRLDKRRIIIVVIEHNMALVRQIADEVIHIDDGKVAYALTRDEWTRRQNVSARGSKVSLM